MRIEISYETSQSHERDCFPVLAVRSPHDIMLLNGVWNFKEEEGILKKKKDTETERNHLSCLKAEKNVCGRLEIGPRCPPCINCDHVYNVLFDMASVKPACSWASPLQCSSKMRTHRHRRAEWACIRNAMDSGREPSSPGV